MKWALPIALLLLLPSSTFAASCFDNTATSPDGDAGPSPHAGQFTVSSDCALTSVSVLLKGTTQVNDVTVYIYDEAGGLPDSIIATSITDIPAGDITGTYALHTALFDGLTTLTTGNTYYVQLSLSDGNLRWGMNSGLSAYDGGDFYFVGTWNDNTVNGGVIFSVEQDDPPPPSSITGTWVMPSFASILASTTEAANLAFADFYTPFLLIFGLLIGGMFALLIRRWIWGSGRKIWGR